MAHVLKMGKIKIAMAKYNDSGKPIFVAHGEYKPQDVEMFKEDGYIDIDEGLAKKIDEELCKDRIPLWER